MSAVSITDKSDVEKFLVGLLQQQFYVDPTALPGSLTPATLNGEAINMEVFRGWATTADLQKTVVQAGGTYVAVNTPDICRAISPGQEDTLTLGQVASTLTASVSGSQVAFGGVGSAGLACGVGYGDYGWTHRTAAGEAPEAVAAAFAGMIPGATSAGPVLTLATNEAILTPIAGDWTSIREFQRMVQRFQIVVWAPDTTTRDDVVSAIVGIVADLPCIALPDGGIAQQPVLKGTPTWAIDESVGLFRRDANFDITYPISKVTVDPAILFVGGAVNNAVSFGQVEP